MCLCGPYDLHNAQPTPDFPLTPKSPPLTGPDAESDTQPEEFDAGPGNLIFKGLRPLPPGPTGEEGQPPRGIGKATGRWQGPPAIFRILGICLEFIF